MKPKESTYLIDKDLEAVVEMSLHMGVTLLVTGEPGTGKTELASFIAQKLGSELLVFNTKTTSKAKDLLYNYNALAHFRDSQIGKENLNPMQYVSFQALGKAILEVEEQKQVVLIDEIDKAPRDFSNDVLYEFERLAFKVDEASPSESKEWIEQQENKLLPDNQGRFKVAKQHENRPVLILTSNSEKNLPDAFLRRCAYYHIPFPQKERLIDIVAQNVPLSESFKASMLEATVDHFLAIRDQNLKKRPATAELLSWVHIIDKMGLDLKVPIQDTEEEIRKKIYQSYSFLLKNKEDRDQVIQA